MNVLEFAKEEIMTLEDFRDWWVDLYGTKDSMSSEDWKRRYIIWLYTIKEGL